LKRTYGVVIPIYMLFVLFMLCADFDFGDGPSLPGLLETAHMGLFGGLSALLGLALRRSRQNPGPALLYLAPIIAAAAYGLSLECVQIALPHRSFEWKDAGLNLAGATLAQVALMIAYRGAWIPAADRIWLPRLGNL